MARPLPRWLPTPLTLASGILISASFAPWSLAPLAWVCLVPWLAALERAKTRAEAAREGLWMGMLMCMGTFHWVAYTLKQFAGLSWPLAYAGLLVFSLFGQPQFLLWGLARHELSIRSPRARAPHPETSLLALALLYAGIEWFAPKLFADSLGHAFHDAVRLRQAADLGGVPLLTALAFWVNLGAWNTLKTLLERKGPSLRPVWRQARKRLLPPVAAALALTAYGSLRLAQVERRQKQPDAEVVGSVIQANIGDLDKLASEQGIRSAAYKVIDTYLNLTRQAARSQPRPDFIVWPETAYPSTFRNPSHPDELQRDQIIERFAADLGVPLLFGGYDRSGGLDYNAFFFLSPGAKEDLQIYRKNRLMLFGEYIPLSDAFPWVKQQFPQVGNFGRGAGPATIAVELKGRGKPREIRFAPAICYEILFSNYMRDAVRLGAHMILNITNDSWFGPVGEPELHLSASKFRAIELRVPALRATNTGITALILPTGELVDPTPLGVERVYTARIPVFEEPIKTGVTLFGEWAGPASLIAGLALAWAGRRRKGALPKH